MKWNALSLRDRRAVMYGALVLLPGLLFVWGWRPYQAALDDTRDQLATERATLVRERALVTAARQNPQLQHVADSAMRAMRPRLFEGKDDVMASAELASYLGDVARKSRVWLQDAGTRPSTPAADGVRTLHVEIRAESDVVGAMMFLQSLERGEKLVHIERLDISRSARANDKEGETLSIAATISGYAIGDSTTASLPAPKTAVASAPTRGGSPE